MPQLPYNLPVQLYYWEQRQALQDRREALGVILGCSLSFLLILGALVGLLD